MSYSTMFERAVFKLKLVIYLLIIVILMMVTFGVYVKVRGVQSIQYMEQQAGASTDMKATLRNISTSLQGIEMQLKDLTKETCLQKAAGNRFLQDECEESYSTQ